jgi:hypothetical protein
MTRRYLLLLVAIVAVAAALSAIGPPRPARRVENGHAPLGAARSELAVVVDDGRMVPAMASVPKGSRVRLRVENRGGTSARLALTGYEDVLSIPALEPGNTWSGEFSADRPGEDFAWILDGLPVARLAVTGSHLVEGHR